MLRIHQPYIKKRKVKYLLVLASIGAFLLGSLAVVNNSSENSEVYAVGDSRTIHDIENMQDMTQQICSNTDYLETNTLKDARDTNSYSIVKLEDNNCWMQENLRLVMTNSGLDSFLTDITKDWTQSSVIKPTTTLVEYGSSNQVVGWNQSNTIAQSWHNSSILDNGVYYNWQAATAGTGDISFGEAQGSICPKNWVLPSGGENGQFYTLLHELNSSRVTSTPYLYDYTGFVSYGTLYYVGQEGIFISSTAAGTEEFYAFAFDNKGAFTPARSKQIYRGSGYSVRCVALGGLDKIEKPIWEESVDGNVNVNVPSILTIDATSGMDEIANASKIIEGTATATISSNTDYSVTLHSTQPALKDIDNSTNASEISPVSSTNPVQPGNNSWGLWNGSGNANSKTYTLPLTTTPTEFPNTTSSSITDKGNTTTHTYYVGISISPALPSGTYGTDVVITASVK